MAPEGDALAHDPELPRRPRDFALLLLALGTDPPRLRARDQQADRAGGALMRAIIDGVAARDPEPDDLVETLEGLARSLGEPTGPARALASQFLHEWDDARAVPGLWSWLLSEAVERSARDLDDRLPRRGRRGGGEPGPS